MQHILLIDDSPPDAQGLRRDFAAAGYSVDVAGSGDIGLAAIRKHPPDLVILDRPQADMEGVRLLQQLHDTAEQVPVLLVGRDPTPTDQVRWLDSGADDCVALTLPFEVVLARARALLRRRPPPPQRLTYADLVIDAASYVACRGRAAADSHHPRRRLYPAHLLTGISPSSPHFPGLQQPIRADSAAPQRRIR